MKNKLLLIIFACLLPACSRRRNIINRSSLPEKISIFIEMPKNYTVFENIGPTVYEAFWKHFERVGYEKGSHIAYDFKLVTLIKKLEHPERFVSPDVLPYVFKVNIELECSLFDEHNEPVTKKTFNFYKWVSRPKDPVLNWTYLLAQYKELLERSVPRIDHSFRPFFFPEK